MVRDGPRGASRGAIGAQSRPFRRGGVTDCGRRWAIRGAAPRLLRAFNGGGMESGEPGAGGLLQQILSLRLVPRVDNGTLYATPLVSFPGAAIAGVYRAAAKQMIPFEALTLGVGQTFCVMVISFSRILATL
ncbi:transmembrane protein 170A isoform 2-T2 [Pangshura tecta]